MSGFTCEINVSENLLKITFNLKLRKCQYGLNRTIINAIRRTYYHP